MDKMIKLFFLSLGRCGTMSIAEKFGFEHEPDGSNPSLGRLAERIRKAEDRGIYGETNNFWRKHIEKLQDEHPDALYIHLVRNPRKHVRSLMTRHLYLGMVGTAPHNEEILPVPGFRKRSRFEKICYYVKYWNERIEELVPLRIRLEDIAHILPVKNETKPIEWSSPLLADFDEKVYQEILGEMIERYGYTN